MDISHRVQVESVIAFAAIKFLYYEMLFILQPPTNTLHRLQNFKNTKNQ